MKTIQQFADIFAKMAKIETKRAESDQYASELEQIDETVSQNDFTYDETTRDKWLLAYANRKRSEKALNKAYADFRKAISEDEELNFLANQFKYMSDQSDRNFYAYVSYEILNRETRNIRIGEYKH